MFPWSAVSDDCRVFALKCAECAATKQDIEYARGVLRHCCDVPTWSLWRPTWSPPRCRSPRVRRASEYNLPCWGKVPYTSELFGHVVRQVVPISQALVRQLFLQSRLTPAGHTPCIPDRFRDLLPVVVPKQSALELKRNVALLAALTNWSSLKR